MDRIIWSGEGYPLNKEWLEFFETQSVGQIQALTKAIGNNAIFSGMDITAGNVSDGLLVYNNEILPFVGGVLGSTIVIIEEVTSSGYDTTNTGDFSTILPVWAKRYCQFGNIGDPNVVDSFSYSLLNRLDNIEELNNNRLKVLREGNLIASFLSNGDADTVIATDDFTSAIYPSNFSNQNGVYYIECNFDALQNTNYKVLLNTIVDGGASRANSLKNIAISEKNNNSLMLQVSLDTNPPGGSLNIEITIIGI